LRISYSNGVVFTNVCKTLLIMTLDTLNKANAVKKTIDKLEGEHSIISKLYNKKESLTSEEIEELIQIAMVNTSYAINRFKEELKNL